MNPAQIVAIGLVPGAHAALRTVTTIEEARVMADAFGVPDNVIEQVVSGALAYFVQSRTPDLGALVTDRTNEAIQTHLTEEPS